METMKIFENKNNLVYFQNTPVRVFEKDGEAWFVAKDICDCIGLANPSQVISRLPEELKGLHSMETLGGDQGLATVDERGMYLVLMSSRKPIANQFRRWMATEILPKIRSSRALLANIPQTLPEALREYANILEKKQKIESELSAVSTELEALKQSDELLSSTLVAKDLGLESAQRLHKILRDLKYIYRDQEGNWVPYAHRIPKDCFEIKTQILVSGRQKTCMKWTMTGKLWVVSTLRSTGFLNGHYKLVVI